MLTVVFLSQPCNNPSCLYLHSIGDEKDSFGKDEVAAVHTRFYLHNFVFILLTSNLMLVTFSVVPKIKV